MATTKREQILDAIRAKITNVPGVNNANVYRSRAAAFQRSQTPAIIIEWVSDSPSAVVIPKTDWQLVVRIAIVVRGAIPDEVADPIVEDVHRKVMSDLDLSGLSMDIQPSVVQNEINEADLNMCTVIMDYIVTYRTSVTDLTI